MEAFEPTLLDRLGERGIRGRRVFLIEGVGAPWDLVLEQGRQAPKYDWFVTAAGLESLAGRFDGVSVGKARLVAASKATDVPAARDLPAGPLTGARLVDTAHAAGLEVYTWTLRPENRFLEPRFRRGSVRAAYGDWAAEFAEIVATGVDGIFVDHPDLGIDVRAAASSVE